MLILGVRIIKGFFETHEANNNETRIVTSVVHAVFRIDIKDIVGHIRAVANEKTLCSVQKSAARRNAELVATP
ncbi:MAG TPA: hypothetical protein V6C72_10400 [Chroococcales cyanobacterium]